MSIFATFKQKKMSKSYILTYFLLNLLCRMQIYSTESQHLNPRQLLIVLEGKLRLSNIAKSMNLDLGLAYFSGSEEFSLEEMDEATKYLVLTSHLDLVEFTEEVDELSLALIHEDFFSHDKSADYKNASALYLTQRILQNKLTKPLDEKPLIELILDFIQNNLDEKLTIELIASEFELSKMQLMRLFAKEARQPVMSEVKSLRIEKASQLLETSELSIQLIAAAIGFADSASFSHFFKKNTGKSPRQLRDEQKWLI